ncbi:YgaP family membrane protein [Natronorubrum texcoconense]|uniref:Inner membrane protein YgaP-like transmembrane domain-containing protein n=1 Tax=Natronorubrum texcoconense TaxID=1095776 RepID=A0A1G8THQ4_9EURY|nr:DUF2892 domain-containing protein [Natronorubrum texcoconense]SDJ40963.1 Protein of unknown function [Natronorubrum texcoconense]
MNRNVGGFDRVLRGVLGIWLVVIAVAAYSEDKRERAAIAAVAGLGLLQNALTGFCGGNLLFGLDTTAGEDDACSLE